MWPLTSFDSVLNSLLLRNCEVPRGMVCPRCRGIWYLSKQKHRVVNFLQENEKDPGSLRDLFPPTYPFTSPSWPLLQAWKDTNHEASSWKAPVTDMGNVCVPPLTLEGSGCWQYSLKLSWVEILKTSCIKEKVKLDIRLSNLPYFTSEEKLSQKTRLLSSSLKVQTSYILF